MDGFLSQLAKPPTQLQQECLEVLIEGKSLLAVVPTGSGKSEMVLLFVQLQLLVSICQCLNQNDILPDILMT